MSASWRRVLTPVLLIIPISFGIGLYFRAYRDEQHLEDARIEMIVRKRLGEDMTELLTEDQRVALSEERDSILDELRRIELNKQQVLENEAGRTPPRPPTTSS